MAEDSAGRYDGLRAYGFGEGSRKGLVFVISAPSGTGKTTLCTRLMEKIPGLTRSVSFTTRPLRPTEQDGQDYHFIPWEAFQEKIRRGELAEWAEVHGFLYGTGLPELERARSEGQEVLLVIDTQGAREIRRCFGREVVTIFLLPPSLGTLEQRLRERDADPEEVIRRRLTEAQREIPQWACYDYVVVNDDFEEAVENLKAIVLAERCRTSRWKRGELQ